MSGTEFKSSHRAGFPAFNHYNIPVRYLLEMGMETECVMPPPRTQETLRRGEKNSPDSVCEPFKHLLGSMMDLLDEGVDVVIMVGGECRLAFFGEMQEKILRDLGYEFTMLNTEDIHLKLKDLLSVPRTFNEHYHFRKLIPKLITTVRMVICLDEIEQRTHENMGFETVPGAYEEAFRTFKDELTAARCDRDVRKAYKKVKKTMDAIPTEKPEHPLRVGIVGEYYTAQDPEGNLGVEEKLCKMGVQVSRYMNFTNASLHQGEKMLLPLAARYMRFYMGPTSATTVGMAKSYAEQGYDGIVHLKSFGCTPEVDVMPLLQRISVDYKVPILYLSYDTQTGEAGLDTRLEAFYDMISMKKKASAS